MDAADKRLRDNMKTVIALFGLAICVAGLMILIAPDRFKALMNRWHGRPRFVFAVIVRVFLGALLWFAAANLKFPLVIKIIAAISILAAVVLLVVGQKRMDRFVDWWMRMPDNVLRIWSIVAFAFGGFLIYVTL